MGYRGREAIKGICLLVIVVCLIGGLFSWFLGDRPEDISWPWRIGSLIFGLLGLFGFLFVHFRQGTVPNYLGIVFGDFFDCKGFGFAVSARKQANVCMVDVVFQNRHSKPCRARIALRPALSFFLKRDQTMVVAEVDCPAGGVGRTAIPVAISQEVMGKDQVFEVIAGVEYPEGRGETLHFGDGIFLRPRLDFNSAMETFVTSLVLGGGSFMANKNARATLQLPHGVELEIPDGLEIQTEIIWQFGDPTMDVYHLEQQLR